VDISGTLYSEHIDEVTRAAERALSASVDSGPVFRGIVFHAGAPRHQHADDLELPFRPVPHFSRWLPLAGPDHLVVFRPGKRIRVIRVVPSGFWYEAPAEPAPFVAEAFGSLFELEVVASAEAAIASAGDVSGYAYVGNSLRVAEELGLEEEAIEPPALLASLDFDRATKTAYEVECIRAAARVAARGHAAVRAGCAARNSARELHFAFLEACGQLESETPYPNIIAWDRATAVLHAQRKDLAPPDFGGCLLIDAGATAHGYACDVTRTYPGAAASDTFRGLLAGMDAMQRRLVAGVRPGRAYLELHEEALHGVAELLREAGLLKLGAEEALASEVPQRFMPHGVGHHLGLQVHDVGGRQRDRTVSIVPPPAHSPWLRTTRSLAAGHVVTIEPGLYFIPMLLDELRAGPLASAIDWRCVDELLPHGGIRIEDDVVVRESGGEDLTRSLIPGHLD